MTHANQISLDLTLSLLLVQAKDAVNDSYLVSDDMDFTPVEEALGKLAKDQQSPFEKCINEMKDAFEKLWVALQDIDSAQSEMDQHSDESDEYQSAEAMRDERQQEYEQGLVEMNSAIYELEALKKKGIVKQFNLMSNVGRAKYVVNFHDGKQTHPDGSPFFGIDTFSNKKKRDAFVKDLLNQGYQQL